MTKERRSRGVAAASSNGAPSARLTDGRSLSMPSGTLMALDRCLRPKDREPGDGDPSFGRRCHPAVASDQTDTRRKTRLAADNSPRTTRLTVAPPPPRLWQARQRHIRLEATTRRGSARRSASR